MSTHKEQGAELTRRLKELSDRIYHQHNLDEGCTYISNSRMERVHALAREMRSELDELEKLGERYLELAPEMRGQLRDDVRNLDDAIRDFKRAVERVYYSNLHETSIRYEPVPVYRRVTHNNFVRGILFGHSSSREYVGQRIAPVMYYRDEQGRVVGRRVIK